MNRLLVNKRLVNQLRFSLMALLAGAASGAGVALIISLIDLATEQLWGGPVEQALGQAPPLAWSVLVCGGVGLLLSLIHRGGPSTLLPELPETMEDLRHPDQAPKRNEHRAILGAALAQIGGGSIGPEALMTRLATLISRWIWKGKDHALQSASVAGSLGFFGAPLLGGMVVGERKQDVLRRWIPGMLGGLSGFAAFHGINEASGGSLKNLPYVWPSNIGESFDTLVAALFAGAVGCGLGTHLPEMASLAGTTAAHGALVLVASDHRSATGCLDALASPRALWWRRADAASAGTPTKPSHRAAVPIRLQQAIDAGPLPRDRLAWWDLFPCFSDCLCHRHGVPSNVSRPRQPGELVRWAHGRLLWNALAVATGGCCAGPGFTSGAWGQWSTGGSRHGSPDQAGDNPG